MDAVVEQNVDESEIATADACDDLASREGKFMTFRLGNEEFGVEVLKVRELIGIMDITKVPQTQAFVEGVINLRGKVIPVIDLRTKFGLERAAYSDQTCVIVVDVGSLMGIIVDTVCEVHDIPADNIEPPPALGCGVDTTFILGLGKVNDEVKILLDIDSVLNSGELVELSKAG